MSDATADLSAELDALGWDLVPAPQGMFVAERRTTTRDRQSVADADKLLAVVRQREAPLAAVGSGERGQEHTDSIGHGLGSEGEHGDGRDLPPSAEKKPSRVWAMNDVARPHETAAVTETRRAYPMMVIES